MHLKPFHQRLWPIISPNLPQNSSPCFLVPGGSAKANAEVNREAMAASLFAGRELANAVFRCNSPVPAFWTSAKLDTASYCFVCSKSSVPGFGQWGFWRRRGCGAARQRRNGHKELHFSCSHLRVFLNSHHLAGFWHEPLSPLPGSYDGAACAYAAPTFVSHSAPRSSCKSRGFQ